MLEMDNIWTGIKEKTKTKIWTNFKYVRLGPLMDRNHRKTSIMSDQDCTRLRSHQTRTLAEPVPQKDWATSHQALENRWTRTTRKTHCSIKSDQDCTRLKSCQAMTSGQIFAKDGQGPTLQTAHAAVVSPRPCLPEGGGQLQDRSLSSRVRKWALIKFLIASFKL